jgi:hypothetical protein
LALVQGSDFAGQGADGAHQGEGGAVFFLDAAGARVVAEFDAV